MKTTTPLSGSHQRTFDRIFQHPISHNLEWRDVHALLEEWGDVEKERNGNLKVTRNGQTIVLHSTSKKDVTEMDEVMALRHFLKNSEAVPPAPSGEPDASEPGKILAHEDGTRKKEDHLAEERFTVPARKAAETNEGGLADPGAARSAHRGVESGQQSCADNRVPKWSLGTRG